MECSQIRDLLPDYSVELLPDRQRTSIEKHLQLCTDCRAELRALDAVGDLVVDFGARVPPPGLFNAVRNEIQTGRVTRERAPWWSFVYSRWAPSAAMGLAMASVLVALWMPVGKSSLPAIEVHPGNGPGVSSSALAQSIRQHAMSAAEGPLTDRVAWEAVAQLVTQEKSRNGEILNGPRKAPGAN